MTRIYVAGAMTGLPDLNFPEFNRAAKLLREMGCHVENPAENPEQPNWEGYMRLAIAMLVTCDEIHMLRGWQQSKGAQLEHHIARQLKLVVTGAAA